MDAPPEALSYTVDELRSYLPSGWELADGGEQVWDPGKRRVVVRVYDNVEFDWPVAITAGAVDEHGRLQALKRAMDLAFRSRLGRPTRGLGVSHAG
jgi:hypothetical protein